jgi:hypothetical protein
VEARNTEQKQAILLVAITPTSLKAIHKMAFSLISVFRYFTPTHPKKSSIPKFCNLKNISSIGAGK